MRGDLKTLGIAGIIGVAAMGYALNQRGYISIPQDRIDDVPEKKAKEIRLSYDEKLKHNLDSLLDEGISTRDAIKDAHTITWEDAKKTMPNKCADYSGEDWVKLDEAQNQIEASRKVLSGRATFVFYKEDYPENLENQIKEKRKELQKLNNKEQEVLPNISTTKEMCL